MHRTKPAQPHQLGDAASVIAIGLYWHCFECVPNVPSLEQFDCQSRLPDAHIQPLRQWSSLKPDPRYRKTQAAKPCDHDLRFAGYLGLAHNPPRGI